MKGRIRIFGVLSLLLTLATAVAFPTAALAAVAPTAQTPTQTSTQQPSDFSLQVTPSPLVTTVKPGVPVTLELKVRNAGSGTEELKIEPRGFDFDSGSGQISIDDTGKTAIADWVKFSNPTFTVPPKEWFTQKVTISVPKEAGFSYSFALIISRKNNPNPVTAGRLIKGSVAVFTLVNVDRPGATRKLEIPKFETTQKLYEYLPATLKIQFKNTGNSIVQPYGNVFVQRKSDDNKPLSTLKVNDSKAYILPGTTRTITVDWEAGFPVYKTEPAASGGGVTRKLAWNWDTASDFRIGKYTAKLVAVYNDGERDIPIEQEVSFWVIPWKAILITIVVLVALFFLSRWRNKRRTEKAVKRALAAQATAPPSDKDKDKADKS